VDAVPLSRATAPLWGRGGHRGIGDPILWSNSLSFIGDRLLQR
jgi:hypothetical protein